MPGARGGDWSRCRGGAIYKPDKAAKYVGQSINAQGNERALRKTEPGRKWITIEGADRPAGTSTARFGSGIGRCSTLIVRRHGSQA